MHYTLLLSTSRPEWGAPSARGRLGNDGPPPSRQFSPGGGAGSPKVQSHSGVGCFWLEKQQPRPRVRGRGRGAPEQGAPGSSAHAHRLERRPLARGRVASHSPRGARGRGGRPGRRQPEGSPPPRGGRSECRLLGAPAPAPPGRPQQAGEAVARAPGNQRKFRGGSEEPPQERAPWEKLGRGTSWVNLGDLSAGGAQGTPTLFYQGSGARSESDGLGDHV